MAHSNEIVSTNDHTASSQPKGARGAPLDRPPVSSFRLSALARDQLAGLAEAKGVTPTRMVEMLVAAAVDDPDSYYMRLAAHHALVASAAALAVAAALSPQLSTALTRSLSAQAAAVLGPLPPRPAGLPDVPETGPVSNFLTSLEALSAAARHGEA